MCGNEVCKTREERDPIYEVVKTWNQFKEMEAEGGMMDDDMKQYKI